MSLARRKAELQVIQTLLREIREHELHLTQVEMAARLGTPQSFVSKYEAGSRRLDLMELRRVIAALEIPMEEFLRRLDARLATLPDYSLTD